MKKLLYLAFSGAFLCASVGVSLAQLTPPSSGITPIAPTHPSATQMHHDDDVLDSFGNTAAAADFWCEHDTAATPDEWACTSTDIDGAGANGIVFRVPDGADDVVYSGAIVVTGSGACLGADSALFDNNGGAVGCPRLTDLAPQGQMLRSQPAFPGGTQTASQISICGGQDETTITIDDFSLCEDDTVTVTVVNSNGANTATVVTESELGGNDWDAATSNAVTATNLAAQLNDANPAGITATAAAAVVRIVLNADTCMVVLAESDAACTTVAVGTAGAVLVRRGSAALPAVAFVEDPDTGLYSSAANTVNLGAAGAAVITASSTAITMAQPTTYTATGGVILNNGVNVSFGTGQLSPITYNTTQTPDSVVWQLDTASRILMIIEAGDSATDFAAAQKVNPTLRIQSAAAASTTQFISIEHDQTNGVVDVGVGAVSIPDGITTAAGVAALAFTNTAASVTLPDNDTTALDIGSTGATSLLRFDTGDATETVLIAGTTATTSFQVDVGNAVFDEDVDLGGAAAALEFTAALSSIVLPDNSLTALDIGSTGATSLMRFDTGDATETVLIAGTATTTAFQVDVGNALFDEDISCGGGVGAVAFTDTASSITLPDNDTTALDIGSTGQLALIRFNTADAAEEVRINGTTGTQSFVVDVGDARFDEDITATGIFASTPTTITIGAGITTFAATRNMHVVTCTAAETLATITGGVAGALLTMRFTNANCTFTDDGTDAANTINISAAFTSTDDDTLTLMSDGTSWREVARAVN